MIFGISAFNYLLSAEFQLKSEGTVGGLPSWTPSRIKTHQNGRVMPRRKFPEKVMVWLGAWSKGITPLVLFEEGILNHDRKSFRWLSSTETRSSDNDWTLQPNGARPHIHNLTESWCRVHLPSLIEKDRRPWNSPHLNFLDYYIYDEVAKELKSQQNKI